jgi:catechol 2,3-dioxygenase-like lactoylglutathione lyase family enzyme
VHVEGFHHLAIQVRHLEETAAFYRQVLGLAELARHVRPDGSLRAIWLSVGGPGFLALEEVDQAPAAEPFHHPRPGLLLVALRISAAGRQGVLAELAKAGVKVEFTSKWTVYFRDPEGNRVALSHHPEDAPTG